jgi:hypothetical protein
VLLPCKNTERHQMPSAESMFERFEAFEPPIDSRQRVFIESLFIYGSDLFIHNFIVWLNSLDGGSLVSATYWYQQRDGLIPLELVQEYNYRGRNGIFSELRKYKYQFNIGTGTATSTTLDHSIPCHVRRTTQAPNDDAGHLATIHHRRWP